MFAKSNQIYREKNPIYKNINDSLYAQEIENNTNDNATINDT